MKRHRFLFLPWMILAIALGATWLVWNHEQQSSEKELRAQFDFALRESASRVEQRVDAYEQLLRGVRGLLVTAGQRNGEAFRHYVGSLQFDASFSGLQAIGIVDWLPAGRKDSYVAAMRQAGLTDFAIRPAGQRDSYAPIRQLEPDLGRNHRTAGFDPWSDPVRRQAMERARDSGLPAMTAQLRLEVDLASEARPGVVMYLPLYAENSALDSVAARRANLTGWVFAAFRMNDMMASLYGEQLPGLALAIYDGVEPSAATLLYRTADTVPSAEIAASEYMVLAGQSWTLVMTVLPDFAERFSRNVAPLIAIAGTGASLLMALLAWAMATGRSRAVRLAVRMTRKLRESEQRWAFALEGARDGVWDWNLLTRAAINSPRWREIVGCGGGVEPDTMDSWQSRIHPDDLPTAMQSLHAALSAPSGAPITWVAEYRVHCDTGLWRWVLSRGMVVERDSDGVPLRMIGTLSDIDARKLAEARIQHLARHDALTDLPNRGLFSDRLQQELVRARRNDARFALLFLDLDQFKPINDNFGHAVGDRLLQLVARRLQETIRESDTVGRIGGDEFVVLVSELKESGDALGLAEKILNALCRPFVIEGRVVAISCSLGVAVYPDDGEDEITLTKSADDAMYRAKELGRNNVQMGRAA